MPFPFDGLASRVASRVESALGEHKFALWFGGAQGFAVDAASATLRVAVPHRMAADWIARHFQAELAEALKAEAGASLRLQVNVVVGTQPSAATASPAAAAPAAHARTQNPRPSRNAETDTSVVWRHRLDTFVVGLSNDLAFAAANRLSEKTGPAAHDGESFQTLFIHGGCGLGKTHLLQGICQRFAENNPGARVVYVTGEQFTNAYIEAVRHNTWGPFRTRFRHADLLAIDDVHFINASKKNTQQEFLHCLEAAGLSHTRIALASDSSPKQLHGFSDKLISLCMQGLVAEVRQPDAATRRALVESLGRRRGLSFLPVALEALCGACSGSVREIEGSLTRLHAMATMPGNLPGATATSGTPGWRGATHAVLEPVGMGLVLQLAQTQAPSRPAKPPKFDVILQVCCARFGAAPEQVKGRSKHRLVSMARACAVTLARELTAMSYPEIAMALGRDSHSTVITAHQRLQKQLTAGGPLDLAGLPADLTAAGLMDSLRQELRGR